MTTFTWDEENNDWHFIEEVVAMKRTEWEFNYTVARVLEAAKAQLAYYESRLAWWTDKRNETKIKIQAEGIEIDESVTAGDGGKYSTSNNFRGESVTIRNDLVKDLNECVNKVAEHRGRIQIMSGWVEVLGAQPAHGTLILHHDDWLFFFSKK